MRILIVTHIGETFGHVVRALALAHELARRGAEIEFAASSRAEPFFREHGVEFKLRKIRWEWSHNSCPPEEPDQLFMKSVTDSVEDLMGEFRFDAPHFVIGFPGLISGYVARAMEIPHACVLHGSYLAPILNIDDPSPLEEAVLSFLKRLCDGPVNAIFAHLSNKFGIKQSRYGEFLNSEMMYVPDPTIQIPPMKNLIQVPFIRASIGGCIKKVEGTQEDSCYISFGTGNFCDFGRVARVVSEVFPNVIVSVGDACLNGLPTGVQAHKFIAHSSLVGKVGAVVSHGGIGTVGFFADYGVPLYS